MSLLNDHLHKDEVDPLTINVIIPPRGRGIPLKEMKGDKKGTLLIIRGNGQALVQVLPHPRASLAGEAPTRVGASCFVRGYPTLPRSGRFSDMQRIRRLLCRPLILLHRRHRSGRERLHPRQRPTRWQLRQMRWKSSRLLAMLGVRR